MALCLHSGCCGDWESKDMKHKTPDYCRPCNHLHTGGVKDGKHRQHAGHTDYQEIAAAIAACAIGANNK